jgi:O-antigen/teichoic acid export membrane protein
VIAASDQVLVNAGPLLVVLAGGSGKTREAGVVFAATMLVRVPVFLFQGLAASLLPNLTTLHALRDRAVVTRAAWRACAVIAAFSAVMVVAATALGPEVMALVYGEPYRVGRLELGLLAVGVAAYLAAATLSQLLLAVDRGRVAAGAWTATALLFVASYAVIPGAPLERISGGFAVAAWVGAAVLAVAVSRSSRP